jgi:hypothetical protein
MEFEGWVPNATGNISFASIGAPLERGVFVRQQLRTVDKRWLLLAQVRKNRDRLVPSWFFPALGVKGLPKRSRPLDAVYTLLAHSVRLQSDEEGALDGQISCLLRAPKAAMFKRPSPPRPSDEALLAIEIAAAGFEEAEELQRESRRFVPSPHGSWAQLTTTILNASAVSCNFRMHRTGKVFLQVTKIPAALEDSERVGLVNQLYYFLKDAVHAHYHHDNSSDGITELGRVGSLPDWRQKTIRNLYREILGLRRSNEDGLLTNALGIIAYSETFVNIFSETDYNIDGESFPVSRLPRYEPAIKTSIDLRRQIIERRVDRKHTDAQFALATVVATFAALFGLYNEFPVDSIVRSISRNLIVGFAYFPVYYLLFVASLWIWYSLSHRDSNYPPPCAAG